MTFTFGASIGSATDKNNNTSLAGSTIATIPIGSLAVISVAADNATSSDGDGSEISSVVDSDGFSWKFAAGYILGNGGATNGIVSSIWYRDCGKALASGATITITFSNNIVSKAYHGAYFTRNAIRGSTVVLGTTAFAEAATDPGSLNVTTANVSALRWRSLAFEIGTGQTITNTASWSPLTTTGTSGAPGDSNVQVETEYRIFTGTGAASDPSYSLATDYAGAYAAFFDQEKLRSTFVPQAIHRASYW